MLKISPAASTNLVVYFFCPFEALAIIHSGSFPLGTSVDQKIQDVIRYRVQTAVKRLLRL